MHLTWLLLTIVCSVSLGTVESTLPRRLADGFRPPDNCFIAPSAGECDLELERWFFDPLTMDCHTFEYGGCGGSPNNFETAEMCLNVCVGNRQGTSENGNQFIKDLNRVSPSGIDLDKKPGMTRTITLMLPVKFNKDNSIKSFGNRNNPQLDLPPPFSTELSTADKFKKMLNDFSRMNEARRTQIDNQQQTSFYEPRGNNPPNAIKVSPIPPLQRFPNEDRMASRSFVGSREEPYFQQQPKDWVRQERMPERQQPVSNEKQHVVNSPFHNALSEHAQINGERRENLAENGQLLPFDMKLQQGQPPNNSPRIQDRQILLNPDNQKPNQPNLQYAQVQNIPNKVQVMSRSNVVPNIPANNYQQFSTASIQISSGRQIPNAAMPQMPVPQPPSNPMQNQPIHAQHTITTKSQMNASPEQFQPHQTLPAAQQMSINPPVNQIPNQQMIRAVQIERLTMGRQRSDDNTFRSPVPFFLQRGNGQLQLPLDQFNRPTAPNRAPFDQSLNQFYSPEQRRDERRPPFEDNHKPRMELERPSRPQIPRGESKPKKRPQLDKIKSRRKDSDDNPKKNDHDDKFNRQEFDEKISRTQKTKKKKVPTATLR